MKDKLIEIISEHDKLLDFMDRYNITGLCEATEEQLKEYVEEVQGWTGKYCMKNTGSRNGLLSEMEIA